MPKSFIAVAIQPEVRTHYITGKKAEEQKRENIDRYLNLIDRFVLATAHRMAGETPKLIVFPESAIHGFGPLRSRDWEIYKELAITIPGEETEALGRKCKEHHLYLAATAYEKMAPDFPDKIFNTGFILDPDGNVALKYRKINTTNNPIELATSPCDILEKYGSDPKKLFPVLETPYGYFGIYICWDGAYPEVARCLALNGAEVLIRPNNQFHGSVEQLDLVTLQNRMRALENVAYVVTCSWAHSPQSEYESPCGHAQVIDYLGRILTEKFDNNESYVMARINIDALREYRKADKRNYLAQLRTEAYAPAYGSVTCWPPNLSSDKETFWRTLDERWTFQDNEVITRLKKQGVIH